MIISIKTTDPLDAGPVNLYSIWDMMDWGRLAQRVFVNTTISGYWEINGSGIMTKTHLLGDKTLDITFTLDMRRMNNGELHLVYQKLRNKQFKQKILSMTSKSKASILIAPHKPKLITPKNTILTLVQQ